MILPASFRPLSKENQAEMIDVATRSALKLGVVGLMNVQFAVHEVRSTSLRSTAREPHGALRVQGTQCLWPGLRPSSASGRSSRISRFRPRGAIYLLHQAPVFPWGRFDMSDVLLDQRCTAPARSWASVGAQGGLCQGARGRGSGIARQGTVFISLCDRDKHYLPSRQDRCTPWASRWWRRAVRRRF